MLSEVEADAFNEKLGTDALFERWLEDVKKNSSAMDLSAPILAVEEVQDRRELKVRWV